jgi:hypothetical protein
MRENVVIDLYAFLLIEAKNVAKARFTSSVANFWQMTSAKSAEKFGRWRKNSAAHILFSLELFYSTNASS